jgi:hypothetical protein
MRTACLSLYARMVIASQDESGLTMLAYALGAAVVIAPLAVAIWGFGTETATNAQDVVEAAIPVP